MDGSLLMSPTGQATLDAVLSAMDGVAYLVTADGVIRALGAPAWDRAAEAGRAPALTAKAVVGRSLFSMVAGEEVVSVYKQIHAGVLSTPRPSISFEYRCDAPDLKRRMRMSVSRLALPGEEPALLYQSQLLSAVARPWVSLFEPERIVARLREDEGLPIVRMCSFCQRFAWPLAQPTAWLEAEDYYRAGGPADVQISHGVCGPCVPLMDAD